jgi:adenine-specific DNA-methyltransferase
MQEFGDEKHKIMHGDVLACLDSIPNDSVDLIFADPPYNIGKDFAGIKDKWPSEDAYLAWCYQWLDACISKLKPTGSLYVMTATQFMPYFDIFLRSRMVIRSRIVWHYDSSGVQAKRSFGSMYEPILFCVKDRSAYTFNAADILVEAKTGAKRKLIDRRKPVPTAYSAEKVPGNVWEFSRVRYMMDEYENHPTQKPVELLTRIVRASSNPGDTVLDPFSGSFTTSLVAKELGRNSIGIEINEAYVKIGLRRLAIPSAYPAEALAKPLRSFEKPDPGKS